MDSEQLESGEGMSDEFKTVANREIDDFKTEYRIRFPDRDPEKLTNDDLHREVMITVGKPGKIALKPPTIMGTRRCGCTRWLNDSLGTDL